jgi:thioredoxin-dependent adenylylsulfate APS reductase
VTLLTAAVPQPQTAEAVLTWARDAFTATRVALVTSFQVEGMVLLDMALSLGCNFSVVTVDTGRLPEETFQMMELVRERYGVSIQILTPNPAELQPLIALNGPNLFRQSVELRMACCDVRKVRPLDRALNGYDAWISGLRRDQASTRADAGLIERDTPRAGITKLNPLANWTAAEVTAYARRHNVPRHPLYARGYRSIGCAPCSRATAESEDSRAGRWWWESEDAVKECGLHLPRPE